MLPHKKRAFFTLLLRTLIRFEQKLGHAYCLCRISHKRITGQCSRYSVAVRSIIAWRHELDARDGARVDGFVSNVQLRAPLKIH